MTTHAYNLDTRTNANVATGRFSSTRLILAGTVALTASLIGALVIRAIATSTAANTSRFTPLHAASVISLTVIGVLLANATCLWLNRASTKPVATFRAVAGVALAISLIPDAVIWSTGAFPQTRAATVLPLVAMHIFVAGICVLTLPGIGQARPHD